MDEHTKACLQAILAKKQMQIFNPSAGWFDCDENTVLAVFSSELYRSNVRIKPEPMCKLAGVEFPMPMSAKPANGDDYYVASPQGVDHYTWRNDIADEEWLALHICHTTLEAAETHSKALRAVNAQAVEKAHAGGVK